VARKDRYVLLIVDKTHLLPLEPFHQLRFLLNDEMDPSSFFPTLLIQPGQPLFKQCGRQ